MVLVWNREATTLYGFNAQEAIGRTLRELHAAELSEVEYAKVLARIRAGVPTTRTVERRKKDGEVIHVLNRTVPIFDLGTRLVGEVTYARDITALHRANEQLGDARATLEAQLAAVHEANRELAREVSARRKTEQALAASHATLTIVNEELEKRAFIDSLTGMPNRVLFEDRLSHAIARIDRSRSSDKARADEKIAVLFVDLDGFKPINDSFGHTVGDKVLIEVAQRLRSTMRASDTVARMGGDEFVLLMEGVIEPDYLSAVIRLLENLCGPMRIDGHEIDLSASIGVALYPDHGGCEELVSHADAAMYAAKRAGGGAFSMFEPHMDAGARERLSLQSDLRHALERGEMELYYQPKIANGEDGVCASISGVEALLRWKHPVRGFVPPAEFIPVAERIGMICKLGDWVIEDACRQLQAWSDEGLSLPVAINISAHQLRDHALVDRIRGALDRHRVHPSQLLCEITESAAMVDVEATQRVFEQMREIGVFLSIDDFGTGYSSLSHLRQLPARQLKIDRSFVTDLESNNDARAVVDAVIHLAHSLDLKVVAEGVETVGQQAILTKLHCDELQGYLFGRPMSVTALGEWLTQHDGAYERPATKQA